MYPNTVIGCLSALLLLYASYNYAQPGTVTGLITDQSGRPVEAVNISAIGYRGTSSDATGYFSVNVPSGRRIVLGFSHINYKREFREIHLEPGEILKLDITLTEAPYTFSDSIQITGERDRGSTMTRLDPVHATTIPSAAGGIEGLLKTLPGVAKSNELTAQYSVRGGNYDENLVYVNDIEIYRPFLIRSGQQEGLSFINSDMVSSVSFSAGGFEASYGDKMSSVLDITYRKPAGFRGTATASLLGGGLHLEDASANYRFTYQLGIRHKSNAYLLNSLDTRGDYRPSFSDLQAFLTYDLTDRWELNFLGNISRNRYRVIPENRETSFGTFNEVLRLRVFFDGQELDDYNTGMGAVSAIFSNHHDLTLKFIGSAFVSDENGTYDIQGQYWLDELERDPSREEFGEAIVNRGVGTYLNHGRNQLYAYVQSLEHRGYLMKGSHYIQWGARYQHELIDDELSEWKMVDSAGFSLPMEPEGMILLQDVIRTRTTLESNRVTAFIQDAWSVDSSGFTATAGVRAHYWDLNRQLVVSPRGQVSFIPEWHTRDSSRIDILFRASGGFYYQPPFYRELRDLEGNVNTNIRAQRSIHLVLGSDLNFKAWNRPFKLVSEIYYKWLSDLIPYEYENLRIRYFGNNNASGHARGIDFKVNGEFVKGLESWVSLGVLQTQEDIPDDSYVMYFDSLGKRTFPGQPFNNEAVDSTVVFPGMIPRPTDQRLMFGLFFQDYLPMLPDFKLHLGIYFGTGLPFGPPSSERFRDTIRMPSYRRVDAGFSYLILGEEKVRGRKKAGENSLFRGIESLWLSAEVFNLLQINNTLDYLWIRDINNRLYAVPNYLTSRLINLKLVARF